VELCASKAVAIAKPFRNSDLTIFHARRNLGEQDVSISKRPIAFAPHVYKSARLREIERSAFGFKSSHRQKANKIIVCQRICRRVDFTNYTNFFSLPWH